MANTLAERIVSARSNKSVRIKDLEKLIDDAKEERERLQGAAQAATDDSVNFALCDDDRDEAAKRAERFTRTAGALTAAIDELSETLEEKRNTEARKAREAEVAALLAERDELAERIKAEWPAIAERAVFLFEEIKASDERIRMAGRHDASAEAIARGCTGNFFHRMTPVKRLIEIQLPSIEPLELLWPRPHRVDLALHMPMRNEALAKSREAKTDWKPYLVGRPAFTSDRVTINTQSGPQILGHQPQVYVMNSAGVRHARDSRCKVEPVGPAQSVGLPASNATI